MDIAMTGANGAVGTALIRHWRAGALPETAGLRALVRRAADAPALQALGAEVIVVDYGQPEALRQALLGIEAVVHLAGALLPRRGETLQQANVDTTQALIAAATACGVKTVVYLSFPGADAASANLYLRAKGQAEAIIQHSGCGGAIFRVPMILGPQSPSTVQLRRMASAPFVPLVNGGTVRIQPLAEADVLMAITWAISTASRPLRLVPLVGPETLTYAALVRHVCARLGQHPWMLPIPRVAAWLSAYLAGVLLPALGWNRSVYDILFRAHLADPAEAQRLLPFPLTPLQVMLDRALAVEH
jgi:NADH dehydrogenase